MCTLLRLTSAQRANGNLRSSCLNAVAKNPIAHNGSRFVGIAVGGGLCLLVGLLIGSGSVFLQIGAVGTVLVVLVPAVASFVSTRAVGRVLAWIGLLAPPALLEVRSRADAIGAVVTPQRVIEGLIPTLCLLGILLICRPPLLPRKLQEWCLWAFVGIALLSSFWSVNDSSTILAALQLAVAYGLLISLVRLYERDDSDSFVNDIQLVIHLIVGTVVAGLLLFPGRALVSISEFDPTRRLIGLFPAIGPNLLAFVAAIGILLLVARVGRLSTRLPIRVLLLTMDLAVLLLTRTRAALGLLIIGLLVLAFLSNRHRARLLLLMPIVPVFIWVIIGPGLGTVEGFVHRGAVQANLLDLTGRTNTWEVALQQWQEQPLIGYGFYAGHRLGPLIDELGYEVQNLDNTWVEVLLDTGVMGCAALGLAVISGGMDVWRVRRRKPWLGALFAMCFVSSFVNPSLQQANYTMILFGLVLLGADASAVVSDSGNRSLGTRHSTA
jgi:O-antigen ligase